MLYILQIFIQIQRDLLIKFGKLLGFSERFRKKKWEEDENRNIPILKLQEIEFSFQKYLNPKFVDSLKDFGQKFSAGLILILLQFRISTFIEKPTKMEGFGWEILNIFSKYPTC